MLRTIEFFIPSLKPSTSLQFHNLSPEAGLPYSNIWALDQTDTSTLTLRFVPDFNLHFVFDLSGTTDVEPFLVYAGKSYTDFEIAPGTRWIGMQFKIWDGSALVERQDPSRATYYAQFDADWVNLIYFWLLEARNRGLAIHDSVRSLRKFKAFIDGTLNEDFDKNFFEIAAASAHKTSLSYSDRHQRRLFQKLTLLSPVLFKRVARFRSAFQIMLQEQEIRWDGYYDQAHFIRDFKQFTGFTPREFLAQLKV
ncbi:MAG: AraC family transcriptional regulator [Anaerolineae bacterium]|nr:AraC family transcriptional regulator [Anaerolineae bacterium]